MPPKKPTRQNSVANFHVEVESQGHSHAMRETHILGGGRIPECENPFGDGHVLAGGEVLVGGPQQMALMFKMIKGMQQTQMELAESLKQLKEEPYLEKYDTPTFALFDGRNGSAMEHISKFLDSMGPFAARGDLCLREFSKSMVDRAYTWYMVLPAGSIRTWEDMVESFCSKYFHVEEKITLVNLHGTKQQIEEDLVKYIHRFRDVSLDCHVKYQEGELVEARKTALSVKPQVEKGRDKKSLPQTLTVSTAATASDTKRKNSTEKVYEEQPPLPFTTEEMMAIFDKWVQDQVIKLPKITKQPTAEEQKDPKYCRYHRYVHHPTIDCRTLRWEVNRKIQDDTLQLSEKQEKVHKTHFPNYKKDKNKAVVSVVIHGNVNDMEIDESAAASSSLVPVAVRTLQKSPKFKSLFNQLGFGPEARNTATEALITIAAESGATCFTAEAHASRAFLETTNAITFIEEDMEVQYPDHRRPLYLSAVVKDVQVRRALIDTRFMPKPHSIKHSPSCQCVATEDPRVPYGTLTRFHVVNAEAPYHVFLGRPWLHKHKLVSSTYHKCVKGRLNEKPIRIAANSSLFDQTEAHFVEAALYDELSFMGDPPIVKPCGTPLPDWEDIKDDPEQTENSEEIVVDQAESTAVKEEKSTTVEPKMTAKEELEVINLSDDPDVSKPISISMSLSAKERKCLIDLLHEYKDVFAWDYDEMPGIDPGLVAHSLNVEPGTKPVVQPMRTFHTEVEAQITQEHALRMNFLFRNMDLLIDSAAGHAMFSFMDGFSGYNQIRMSTKDAEKTVFRTPIGNFYYTVMPFGLKHAGATYQRTMTAMFHDMMHKEIEDYVDDIVVKSKKREDRLETLRKVFDRCRLFHNRGIDVDPAKASAITTMKAPTSHKELKSFLGRLSYIRRFILGLAAITAVFKPLMKKRVPFVWSTTCQRAFEKIQVIMTKLPTVCALVAGRLLPIKSQAIADLLAQFPGEDSSSILHEVPGGVGETLLADLVDSTWTLKFDGSSTSNSSGAEYEAYITGLAIAHEMGIKHLQDALTTLGSQISFEGLKVDVTINKRSMPITDLLKEEFEEQYLDAEDWRTPIKAKLMSLEGVADLKTLKDYVLIAGDLYRRLPGGVLARCVSLQETARKLTEVHEKSCEFGNGVSLYRRLQLLGYFWLDMSKEAASLQEQCSFCQHQHEPAKQQLRLKKLATRYFVEGGILFWKGFPGDPLNVSAWPNFKQDMADFIKSCHTCQLQANLIHTHPTNLQNMVTPWPFHTWGLDLIGPINLPFGGYIWILVATEYFSKWVEVISLRKATDAAVANFIREHIITSAYEKTLQTRIFAKGQMVMRTVDHVRRGLPSLSKFAPNWEGPYLIREAYDSGYYKLATADGTTLADPINGKWLKRYYSKDAFY
uniref:Reverse transcriptase domain-containing protein n=1 Tax=Fagus sylvatica TaxID=28930 RepID=A0A2N9J549_FAGSY